MSLVRDWLRSEIAAFRRFCRCVAETVFATGGWFVGFLLLLLRRLFVDKVVV